jgi:hypothetical protein
MELLYKAKVSFRRRRDHFIPTMYAVFEFSKNNDNKGEKNLFIRSWREGKQE